MNIIMYQWKAHQHHRICQCLLTSGHQVYEYRFPISNPETDTEYVERLLTFLQKNPYDFLFSINYFPVLSEACQEAGIPYVSWTCDSPLLAMHHSSIFHDCNHIFVFDRSEYLKFQSLGVNHLYYLPLGASFFPTEAGNIQATGCIPDKMEYSVSFVGSLYDKNEYDTIAPSLPPYLAGYLDCALEAQLQISGGNLLYRLLSPEICEALEEICHYQKAEESFSTLRLLFANTVLGFKAASMERIRCLNQVSHRLIPFKGISIGQEDGVHLFTDSSPDEWQNLSEELPLVNMHPAVDYETELAAIFQKSRINLNFTIPNIQTGVPLRAWDVMGAGAFLLSNEQEEIHSLLKPGEHLECFASSEELIDKTLFYLKHEDARQKIARQGQQYIYSAHTVEHRIDKLLSTLKQNI